MNVQYPLLTFGASGGSGSYVSWSATGLPAGMSVNSNGVLGGNPQTASGSPYSVTVTVTDTFQTSASAKYTLVVATLPLTINTVSLPTGVVNATYPYTSINATGGVGTYTYSITGLPAGLTTDGNGDITGKPTTATGSPFTVTVTVTDSSGNTVKQTYSLTISSVLTITAPTTLPTAGLNTPYTSTTLSVGGGIAPYTWSATGLPTGLSIGLLTGTIGGTATVGTGSPYAVVVTVTDSTGTKATMNYSLTVGAGGVTITGPSALPSGTVGVAYTSTSITATGGSSVYTYTATGLPSGLTINSTTGAITGTPTTTTGSPFTVVVTVTDSSANTATKSYALTINPGTSTLPLIASVSTSAGGQSSIGPNTWVSVYGSNFAAAGFSDTWTNVIKASSTGALPTTLDGVSVMVGGVPAYIAYLSATQINILTANIGLGSVQVTVTTAGGGTSAAVTVTSQTSIPAFFPWPVAPGGTVAQPVATHLNYSYAVAAGTFPTVTTVPAAPGETIVLWGSGFGPTTPPNPFGVAIPATPAYPTSANVTVSINGAPATVYQGTATLASALAGVFQVGVTIPASLANGTYPVTTTINGITSPTLMLTVHN